MIIDDEPDLCSLMKAYFSRKNYEVHYRHTLADGILAMKNFHPDILFLDNNLPDGTGWLEVYSFLQLNPALQLCLMSGYLPAYPEIPGVRYDVLTKPISFEDLKNF